ncbi:Ldh family oxidoreductase [Cyclobacterium plantarum]|uniref:Ldh family oxidoreductase n=1 Tax=Cyclobacterium plantarum TaxID=2716263 RepID=A0ABX0HG50_9BACT|nr:Ldh family oxidoreductase [Cyclobacterium plantarum]NHE59000.1 Ldh family oxidoreductase [Cyclobacterium plantarum]
MEDKRELFEPQALRDFIYGVFMYFDVPEEDALLATDVLAYSDEHGIDSHGIARLKTYFGLLQAGRINPRPRLQLIREKHAVVTVDGDNGLGLVIGPKCMEIAIEKAREYGTGSVAVSHTNHFGAAGYYPLMAVKHDFIGMSMTNTSKGVAAFNGKEKMLGTNPVAMAFPTLKEPVVLMDFASSTVAYGKVEIAKRAGKKVPIGWCLDENGQATEDPERMINGGALLPLGSSRDGSGHKGYCLAGMVDILSAVLSGANWGPFAIPFAINTASSDKQVGKGIGHFFSVWDVDGFREVQEFKEEMDEWVRTLRAAVPLQGAQEVLIPGDPEWRAYEVRMKSGIPLQMEVVMDLKAISQTTGIPMP